MNTSTDESVGTVTFSVAAFGKWHLGYQWVTVTLGHAATTGLALYARREGQDEPFKYVVFSLKEAIGFFAEHRVPAKATAKLLRAAEADAEAISKWFVGAETSAEI